VLGTNTNLIDSDGNTPVHIAISNGANDNIVSLLVSRGYNLNRRNSEGVTPLMLAVKRNRTEAAQTLLRNGADPFIFDNSGECVISLAIKENLSILNDVAKIMPAKTDMSGDGILHYAAQTASADMIKRLLAMGLDKTARNISGELPYNVAVRWQNTAAAAELR
jgi:ankyrin repeat protein